MTDKPNLPPTTRKPGEALFAVLITIGSAVLLWDAYGISGFKKLSAPGSVPMATTAIMLIAAVVVLQRTLRRPLDTSLTVKNDILPLRIIVLMFALVAYGMVFKTVGFLPASAVFLVLSIKYLSKRSWVFCLTVGLGSLLAIWVIFRVVFTVLLPAGYVPEAEILQFFRNLAK